MKDSLLSVLDVSQELDGRSVLRGIRFEVKSGEFFSLLGPSGCGKTTLLRIIAGFLKPTSGELLWNGRPATHLPPQKRDLNLVFQNYALFPHMNVFDNVAFGLRMQKLPEAEVHRRTQESLELVRMNAFSSRRPSELSGGQQQRIALARAVAPRPRLVLLDEPLGALDLQLRKQMQVELKSLQRQLGMTFIYVTHDQEEAFAMSDRIAVLHQGVLEQVATPEMLYRTPASPFVAQFIGTANFLDARLTSPTTAQCPTSALAFNIVEMNPPDSLTNDRQESEMGQILVRPEEFELITLPTEKSGTLSGVVRMRQYLGGQIRYHVELAGMQKSNTNITVDLPSHDHNPIDLESEVLVNIKTSCLPFFRRNSLS